MATACHVLPCMYYGRIKALYQYAKRMSPLTSSACHNLLQTTSSRLVDRSGACAVRQTWQPVLSNISCAAAGTPACCRAPSSG